MDERTRYEAVSSRDARFDGAFFFAVVTTGIYCRPSCPAVTPKRANVRFYPTAAAAQAGGFRACRRCRPDAVPGSAEWNVRADVVGRAMRLIGDGVVDREGVPGLAGRLGYSARQVQRQLNAELGAGPVALARAQRSHTARVLLQTTGLPVTEIAFAAGFASVRQFNDTIRRIYARTPSALRAEAGTGLGGGRATGLRAGIPLRLAHRGPYAAGALFDLLGERAVDRVEEMAGEPGCRTYRRTLRLPYGTGIAAVDERSPGPWLEARIHLTDLRDLTTAVQRLRRLFDLDADPYAVDEALAADPRLAPLVAARPGLRSPGARTRRRRPYGRWWGGSGRRSWSSGTGRCWTCRAARSPMCSRSRACWPGPSPTPPCGPWPPRSPTGSCGWTRGPTGRRRSARWPRFPGWTGGPPR